MRAHHNYLKIWKFVLFSPVLQKCSLTECTGNKTRLKEHITVQLCSSKTGLILCAKLNIRLHLLLLE